MNTVSMQANRVNKTKRQIVVAGGGTSGWLAAAAIGKVLGKVFDVTLVESEAIGRIGVGEATIPPLRTFHRLLGIDEADLMRSIQATVKLGIEFQNWGDKGQSYIHSFGVNGKDCWACGFHHFWAAGRQLGLHDDQIGLYCRELMAARANKAMAGENSGVHYAYHLDAGLYAGYLKKLAMSHGVKHINGTIETVNIDPVNGHIASLSLKEQESVPGDLFIDCTGFAARLISGALNVSYVPYGHYLPCDSAVAVQTELSGPPKPYTQSIAHEFGWQWRIPLQHRAGNGLVYSSRHVSDDEAMATLMANLQGKAITEPRAFKYKTGRIDKAWHKNCVAIGLASGFLEPLESTSIHLAMSSILRLLKLFPLADIQPSHVDEFNRQTREEMDKVRNFIILHYHATQREDTPFWRYCKNMAIPEELEQRIRLFRETGAINLGERELFQVDSWVQVMLGQGIEPESYHPIVDAMGPQELSKFLDVLKQQVNQQVSQMPDHQRFLDHFCKAHAVDTSAA